MNLFQSAIARKNQGRPPVWFMRQAGRYHSHYQKLKKEHSFVELCKNPDLAAEVTFGPVEDFGFDAAILFSDLLFPLDVLGMGLSYVPGPKLDWHLQGDGDLARLKSGGALLARELSFQAEAIRKIKIKLSPERGLIGFVGGPFTLFRYATAGNHETGSARFSIRLFEGFCDRLRELLSENMREQAQAGLDAVAVFDTSAGEVSEADYRSVVAPALAEILTQFRKSCPEIPVIYYSKGTGPTHWEALRELPIQVIGVDWNHELPQVFEQFGSRFAIQGNFDPSLLLLEKQELEIRLRDWFQKMKNLPVKYRAGWICGLGHGVLQGTPEENVRLFLKLQKEYFSCA